MTEAVNTASDEAAADAAPARKRPKPGERRIQILQALATMLEQPRADRITTAALAAHLQVSEAALYRHFASKAQMYEGLIGFIEESLFGLANQIQAKEPDPTQQIARIVSMVLQFAEKNRGMCRVMVGDALVSEHERLTLRMNQCWERMESVLRQSYKALFEAKGVAAPTAEALVGASLATSVMLGRLHRFARTDFRRAPTEHLEGVLQQLLR